jgi:hypothetical protein
MYYNLFGNQKRKSNSLNNLLMLTKLRVKVIDAVDYYGFVG